MKLLKKLQFLLIFTGLMVILADISFSIKDYNILKKSENIATELIDIYIQDINHFDKINKELAGDKKIAITANNALWLKDIETEKESNDKRKKEINMQLDHVIELRNEINTRKEKLKSNLFNFIVLFLIAYSGKKIIDYEKNYYAKNFKIKNDETNL